MLTRLEALDDVLRMGVKGISDIITKPGLVNVDFADVRSVMWAKLFINVGINAITALIGITKQWQVSPDFDLRAAYTDFKQQFVRQIRAT